MWAAGGTEVRLVPGLSGLSGLAGIAGIAAEAASTGLALLTGDLRVVWVNPALLRIIDSEPAPGAPPPTDPRVVLAEAGLPLAGVEPDAPARVLAWTTPRGARRQLGVTCRRIPPGGSELPWDLVLYEITDVTARQEQDERARRREQRLAQLAMIARTGCWEWNVVTGELRCSDVLVALLGFPAKTEIDYPTYRALIHPDDRTSVAAAVRAALDDRAPFTFVHRLVLPDGLPDRVLECHAEVTADAGGHPVRVRGLARDVTAQHGAQRELRYLAEHDPLTGLRNRRAVTAHLAEALAAQPQPGALLLIDLDHFKDTNDLRGHGVGDQVLRSLSRLLREQLPGAVVGRLGADEFAVVLPDGDGSAALARAWGLCRAIARRPIVADGTALRVTASIGVAPLAGAPSVDEVLARADLALGEAKRRGRDGARLFAAELYDGAARRISGSERVRAALDAGLITLDAQPIVDLASGAVDGYELLARLRDGQDPDLGPAEFLAAAECGGLMRRLDRWMVEQAVAALATPSARSRGLRFAVNVSQRSLEDPFFADHVIATVRGGGVPASHLALEITETAAITSLDAARGVADQLTAAGCGLTLDDFGAGFGSVVHLRQLPFTAVKIDGQLVRPADRTEADVGVVAAVMRVARGLGRATVAGNIAGNVAGNIDLAALVETLGRLGVDRGQEFLLACPRPLTDLLAEPPSADRNGAPSAPGARTASDLPTH
jgi:diguanylate cyclase (GGDEF)-like protein